ncbi:MAG TPA: hypothetical protein VIM98_01270 [Dyella sp.]|uniref:hypothetical protein n=1 Tax=Dyella sp. TaxID=1869338 RepID=UPI002F94DD05
MTAWICLVAAHAGDAGKPAAQHADTCVDVSINDRPVLAYACLNRQLAPSMSAPFTPNLTAGVAHDPSNRQVGQFNYSAFSNRMGNQLGKSVHPQRPPPLVATPPLLAPGR